MPDPSLTALERYQLGEEIKITQSEMTFLFTNENNIRSANGVTCAAHVELNPFRVISTGGSPATVIFSDFVACNAVEHVLDTVLLPESVSLP